MMSVRQKRNSNIGENVHELMYKEETYVQAKNNVLNNGDKVTRGALFMSGQNSGGH